MKKIQKKSYDIQIAENILQIFVNGKMLLSIGASASVNGSVSELTLVDASDQKAIFRGENDEMQFEFEEDCIKVSYAKCFESETPIYVSKLFATPGTSINIVDFDRGFTPQARNNSGENMEFYRHLPDISANGYFSPSLFNFSVGNRDGWVSFGLLAIPDSKICKMDQDKSFLIESCGGNKVIPAGGTYHMPGVLITFPKNEWDGIRLFRQKLIDFGLYTPKKSKFSEFPSWWKNPFICTYGDQMLEDRVGQAIDENWVTDFVDIAETDWGFEHINLIIDDSWQLPHAFEPVVDTNRFPDFRKFIDHMHDRGHHVILWQTPMFDNIANGFKTRAQRLKVLSGFRFADENDRGNYCTSRGLDCYAIDYTADNARQFLREICEIMFGDGEGQYNADGIKLDFIGLTRDPEKTNTYAHPDKGVGAKELLLFYEMFYEEAKRVKADVLIDCTVGDPRFEHAIDFNRLHDTHCGTIEKDLRAAIAASACPDLPIDSDGALMFVSWLKTHYISSAIYGVPSLYYLKHFHDFASSDDYFYSANALRVDLTTTQKHHLANLLQMTRYRPDGNAVMESYGNWLLTDNGTVNAISQKGETVVYYPTKTNDTGYIFTWQDEVISIPLHGRKLSQLLPGYQFLMVDYAQDRAFMRLTPGTVYTFKNIDDHTSVDRNFSQNKAIRSEEEMNYVNH